MQQTAAAIVCSRYIRSSRNSIVCTGSMPGKSISITYTAPSDCDIQRRVFCCQHFKCCEVYRMCESRN